jgi:hypothetical protein
MNYTKGDDAPSLVATSTSKKSSLSAPSKAATPANGYNEVASKLRSVTMHRLAFDIARHNQGDGQLPRLPGDPNLTELENVFFTMLQWKSREEEMTIALAKHVAGWLSSKKHTTDVRHNRCQRWEGDQSCRLDILVQRRENVSESKPGTDPAVLLIEVGISDDHSSDFWWLKADQAFMYVRALRANGLFRQPMLVAILTISFEKGEKCAGRECVRSFRTCRLGVFLATPKNIMDYRAALLWHTEFNDNLREHKLASSARLHHIAYVFAKLLNDTRYVMDGNADPEYEKSYEYLGPHCCRLGDKVRVI